MLQLRLTDNRPQSWFIVLHESLDKVTRDCKEPDCAHALVFREILRNCCRNFYRESLLIHSKADTIYKGCTIAWPRWVIRFLMY